jgi:hypothetical protein
MKLIVNQKPKKGVLMKMIYVFCLLTFATAAFAQTPASPAPAPAAVASPLPAIAPLPATATPVVVAPSPIVAPAQVPVGDVAVAAPAAPPAWFQEVLTNAQSLPVVGPYIAKALVWLGIIAALLTALVAFLLAISASLKGVLNVAGLNNFATEVQAFQDGKIMYWIKYFSMFNAQKKSS